MKVNSFKYFNGKEAVTSKDGKLESLNGSALTGLQFTQLEDVPDTMIANRIISVNSTGDKLEFVEFNPNNNKVIEFGISDEENVVTWSENHCQITHNLNGLVLFQIYNYEGVGIPVVPIYLDENNIAFYLNGSDLPTDENKHTIFFYKGGMQKEFSHNYSIIDNMPVELTFIDETYGRVCYLDSTIPLMTFFNNILNLREIQLYLVSANPEITGNIVLVPIIDGIEQEQIIVPVNSTPTIQKIPFNATGKLSIKRDYDNELDTLKDGDPITAIVINTRFIVEV